MEVVEEVAVVETAEVTGGGLPVLGDDVSSAVARVECAEVGIVTTPAVLGGVLLTMETDVVAVSLGGDVPLETVSVSVFPPWEVGGEDVVTSTWVLVGDPLVVSRLRVCGF